MLSSLPVATHVSSGLNWMHFTSLLCPTSGAITLPAGRLNITRASIAAPALTSHTNALPSLSPDARMWLRFLEKSTASTVLLWPTSVQAVGMQW